MTIMNRKIFSFLLALVALAILAGPVLAQDADPAMADGKSADISAPFDLERCVKRALDQNPAMTAIRAQLK